jgi:DNA-binding transcriptional regulator LsrR (DeoR family)
VSARNWQARVAALLAQGLSPVVIAERLGVSRFSVQRVRRGMQEPARKIEDLPPETWPALYAGGATLEQIANRTGLSLLRVRRELVARGVTIRPACHRR